MQGEAGNTFRVRIFTKEFILLMKLKHLVYVFVLFSLEYVN